MSFALGQGWNFWSQQVPVAMRAPLAELATRAARVDGPVRALAGQILFDWRCRQSGEARGVLAARRTELTAPGAAASRPRERLAAWLGWTLSGMDDAAKAALTLANEMSVAYKHLLVRESERRLVLTGPRLLLALVHRCLQCTARILVNSYLSYAPVPPKTWLDAHAVYAFASERHLSQLTVNAETADMTPERAYLQTLLLALANPYGFLPGQLATVAQYLQAHCHLAKLTEVAPVHRMAKAVAIVPVGHDFPPFSANKGGAVEGSKIYLLTYDLAFQLQEEGKLSLDDPISTLSLIHISEPTRPY